MFRPFCSLCAMDALMDNRQEEHCEDKHHRIKRCRRKNTEIF